jgi:hypothetical protein
LAAAAAVLAAGLSWLVVAAYAVPAGVHSLWMKRQLMTADLVLKHQQASTFWQQMLL